MKYVGSGDVPVSVTATDADTEITGDLKLPAVGCWELCKRNKNSKLLSDLASPAQSFRNISKAPSPGSTSFLVKYEAFL